MDSFTFQHIFSLMAQMFQNCKHMYHTYSEREQSNKTDRSFFYVCDFSCYSTECCFVVTAKETEMAFFNGKDYGLYKANPQHVW